METTVKTKSSWAIKFLSVFQWANFFRLNGQNTVVLTASTGIFVLSGAYALARLSFPWTAPFLWLGLVLIYFPVVLRLTGLSATRNERIWLLILLGGLLYLVKVYQSPMFFNIYDEFAHWRTANDLLLHQQLFMFNPLKPISPFYPGMEIIAAYMSAVTGFDLFVVGTLLLLVARIMLIVALFLFYEAVASSARTAAVAVCVYTANPNFIFFGAQFAYESLALSVLALALFVLTTRRGTHGGVYHLLTLLAIALVLVLTITHHLTMLYFVVFLLAWQVTDQIINEPFWCNLFLRLYAWYSGWAREPQKAQPQEVHTLKIPVLRTVVDRSQLRSSAIPWIALAAFLAWSYFIAVDVFAYVIPHFSRQIDEFIRLIMLESSTRALFVSGGQVAPLWNRIVSYLAVFLVLAGLPFGVMQVYREKKTNVLAYLLTAIVFLYPLSLVVRLVQYGWEIANRSSEFIFLSVGYVLSVGMLHRFPLRLPVHWRQPTLALLLTLLFLGGLSIGWSYWSLLPGSYLVSDGARSIEREGLSASAWMKETLGPGNRISADRVNTRMLGSYGQQSTITAYSEKIRTAPIFFAQEIGPEEEAVIRGGAIEYFLVDQRLASGLPLVGVYFEDGEPDAMNHSTPIPRSALEKFDRSALFNRLYDSGSIQIFETIQGK